MTYDLAAANAASQLEIVAREMGAISERLAEASARARGLAAATDWQSRAAEAFHRAASEWAGEVSSLVCVAETAELAAAQARDASWARAQGGF